MRIGIRDGRTNPGRYYDFETGQNFQTNNATHASDGLIHYMMKAGVDGTYGYLRYDTTPYFGIVEC